jgi:hypothetical protein
MNRHSGYYSSEYLTFRHLIPRIIIDVVGIVTTAHQNNPVLWDSDDTPEGNRESQIPMRHGQTVRTALKKLANLQTLQRYDGAFEATDGSVFREGCGITLTSSGMVPLCLIAPNSPCSVDSLNIGERHFSAKFSGTFSQGGTP